MADLTITPANVANISGSVSVGTAGEAFTQGAALYLKSSDNRLYKAQADGTSAEATCVGIALTAGVTGQPACYTPDGDVNIGATTAKNVYYVVSNTPGGICPSTDLTPGGSPAQYISYIGYATNTTGTLHILRNQSGVTA
jgi:hypothetical protein